MLGIALIAGGTTERALLLAVAMLGVQFCIGTVNDLFDEDLDAVAKPWKPLPAGIVSRGAAWSAALVSGAGSILASLLVSPITTIMGAAMLGAGLVYDGALKRTPFGWVPFAIAFPLLPVFAWHGATGQLPPRWEVLVPVAALAGPALQLANGLVDVEADAGARLRTLATVLGRSRALLANCVLLFSVHAIAWLTLSADASLVVIGLAGLASACAVAGVSLLGQSVSNTRQLGWSAQALSVAFLGAAWLAAAAVTRPA